MTRKSSSLDRRSNDVSITEAGLRALAAARKVERETLPPDIVEGTVLSRELARVISHFPGSPRLGSRQRKGRTAGSDVQGEEKPGTGAQDEEAVTGPDGYQMESMGPKPGEPGLAEAGISGSGKPGQSDESGSPLEPTVGQPDGALGEAPSEKARHLNGNGKTEI